MEHLSGRIVDYHVHSNHSCDGKSTISEMCRKAIELGIAEIGFSEHMDFEPKDLGYGFFDYGRYSSEIESAQGFFGDRIVIRKGIEVDYQHFFEEDIKRWLQNKRFDFIIGSVHYLDHEIIGGQLVRDKDLKRIYDDYFDEVTYSIESSLFNVMGHFDLVARYVGNRKSELREFGYLEGIRTVLGAVIERKTCLEINSKGFREEYGDTIPSRRIVREYVENGGRLVSVGSDAHSTKEIGGGIKETLRFLANCNGNKPKLLFE